MKLEINCPECGYNTYKAIHLLSGEELNVTVSKCDNGSCDLIVEGLEPEHYEDFNEMSIWFNGRFEITETISINCID